MNDGNWSGDILHGSLFRWYHLATVCNKVVAIVTTSRCSYLFYGRMTNKKQGNKGTQRSVNSNYQWYLRISLPRTHFHLKKITPWQFSDVNQVLSSCRKLYSFVYTGHAHSLAKRLERAGRYNSYLLITFPGAGHSVYLPHASFVGQSGRTPGTKEVLFHGGNKYSYERAQWPA